MFQQDRDFHRLIRKEGTRSEVPANHEPGSGSAFINYYLSVNTVCGTFVRDLSHTRTQPRTWQGLEWDSGNNFASVRHIPRTLSAAVSVARVREGQHVFIIAWIDCRYRECSRYGGPDMYIHTYTFVHPMKTFAIVFRLAWTISCVFLAEIKAKRLERNPKRDI